MPFQVYQTTYFYIQSPKMAKIRSGPSKNIKEVQIVYKLFLVSCYLIPIIWIFTEGEGDEIESRLPFKIYGSANSSNLSLALQYNKNVGPKNKVIYLGVLTTVWMRSTKDLESLGKQVLLAFFFNLKRNNFYKKCSPCMVFIQKIFFGNN